MAGKTLLITDGSSAAEVGRKRSSANLLRIRCEEETVIIFAQKSTNLRTVAGIPQAVRMKISGYKTDSMERRYNIVDTEDLSIAKEFMERRMKAAKNVAKV